MTTIAPARPHIRAATNAAITLGTLLTRIPHSQDSDNVECEIETIGREIFGCRSRDYEFANVIVDSSSAKWLRFENADCAADIPKSVHRVSAP